MKKRWIKKVAIKKPPGKLVFSTRLELVNYTWLKKQKDAHALLNAMIAAYRKESRK